MLTKYKKPKYRPNAYFYRNRIRKMPLSGRGIPLLEVRSCNLVEILKSTYEKKRNTKSLNIYVRIRILCHECYVKKCYFRQKLGNLR